MASKNEDVRLVESSNDLAVRLCYQLLEEDGNIFFSPFSICAAMSMLLRGTEGGTEREMRQVLGYESTKLDSGSVHEAFKTLLTSISQKTSDSYVLTVANGVISSKIYTLVPEYLDDLKTKYGAEGWEVDFGKDVELTIQKINGWVKEKTGGMISEICDSLDPRTVAILLNAIYFKGKWEHPFDPISTFPAVFFNKGSRSNPQQVPTMSIEENFRYLETPQYKALELPYIGDDVSMLLLLPEAYDGLSQLEKQVNLEFIETLRRDMTKNDVKVFLPKFNLKYSKSMKSVFESLGLHKIFGKGADFKPLSDHDIFVSEILHKAVIDVNEEGSVAAAVTEVVCVLMCLRIVPEFRCDHPFLFWIYNKKNGMILFMGRVEEF